MSREIQPELQGYANADGTPNWDKLESGAAQVWLKFEKAGTEGYAEIESQSGIWKAVAVRNGQRQSKEITREQAVRMAAQIRSNPSAFKILFDGKGI